MGSNTIIAIVVGAVLVIVGFTLWPVLNGASNSLYAYFRDSCDDGNGNRFLRIYFTDGTPANEPLPSPLNPNAYYVHHGIHGGAGTGVSDGTGLGTNPSAAKCGISADMDVPAGTRVIGRTVRVPGPPVTIEPQGLTNLVNEHGDVIRPNHQVGSDADASFVIATQVNIRRQFAEMPAPYQYIKVSPMLQRFSGINNLLLTILPVVSIAGFLGISGAKLYSYGKGTASIGSSISTSVFTLIGIVVAMVIAGPIMGAAVDANQVVISGQYQVNGTFGNIIQLLFAMIPVVYIAGLVTLVGLQARTALMGSGGGG